MDFYFNLDAANKLPTREMNKDRTFWAWAPILASPVKLAKAGNS